MTGPLTVIVSPQIPIAFKNGGIGTFVYHLLALLCANGNVVKVIFTGHPEVPEKDWRPFFKAMDVEVIVIDPEPNEIPVGYHRFQYVSQLVSEALARFPDVAVVYYADWRANALVPIKSSRTSPSPSPPIVTIMHGNSAWHRENMQWFPSSVEELTIDACERYCVENSDYAVSPSYYGLEWARRRGWRWKSTPRVLHYPFVGEGLLSANAPTPETPARVCREIIFFGRLETRKGIEIFVESLEILANMGGLGSVEKVVLVGQEAPNRIGSAQQIAARISRSTGVKTEYHTTLGMTEAVRLLSRRVDEAVVAIPSAAETLGFVAIECSLIPGMDVICSDSTAMPEVFGGRGSKQLFEPTPIGLASLLRGRIREGLASRGDLAAYDFRSANQSWLEFHQEVLRSNVERTSKRTMFSVSPGISVDICIPNYNLSIYLRQALEGLKRQTTTQFNVFVLNDGSAAEGETERFDQLSKEFGSGNWHFSSQENAGVCVARNRLAAMGTSKYIIWMDADNVPAPNMVKRFLEAIEVSGDDVMTCYSYQFEGAGSPYLDERQGIPKPAIFYYVPVGNFPTLSLVNFNPFGDLHSIMRRDAFNKSGGFAENYPKDVNHEDQQLFVHMSLLGLSIDVVPEYLYFYRIRPNSRLRISPKFLNESGVLDGFRTHLETLGMGDAAPFVAGLFHSANELRLGIHVDGQSSPVSLAGAQLLSTSVPMSDLVKAMGLKVSRRVRARMPFVSAKR